MKALMILSALLAAQQTDEDLLQGADARIEKHRRGDAVIKLIAPTGSTVTEGTAVQVEQTRHAFLFGSNIFKLGNCGKPELNEAYGERFADLLNFATLPFYWWGYEREKGKPDYAKTDKILDFCEEKDIVAKGHPLAWNWMDPKWLPKDPAEAMKLQYERIDACIRRFNGRIDIWDVVNEATHHDRPDPRQKCPILTEAITQMGVGPYVRQAFQTARRAHPRATLIINDYRTDDGYEEKVVRQLLDDGKPLFDVIGIQSHQHGGAGSMLHWWNVCERYKKFGKPIHFTETTFLSGKIGWNLRDEMRKKDKTWVWESTEEGEKRQAQEVVRFYTLLYSHPAVEAITWWDLTDLHSWQGAPCGLIRADMSPKPAYEELMKLVKGKWWTKTSVKAEKDGVAKFRATYGDYRVTLEYHGRKMTGTFTFRKDTELPIRIRLE